MMSPEFVIHYLLPAFAFAVGACIGSFLNVVIYRLPNGLSVNEPRRSFCPICKAPIPIWLNIPLFTWLQLRGRCKNCAASIPFRYFFVELFTAVVFWAIWQQGMAHFSGDFVTTVMGIMVRWVFVALLISATFIDFDHLIIPDSITIGGTVAGVLASLLVPGLHGELIWWRGGLFSILGAMIGFSLLWLVVLMGKAAFGKIKHEFAEPVDFEISQPGGEEAPIIIQLGEHQYEWGDVFFRKSDRLELMTERLAFDGVDQDLQSPGSFRVLGESMELNGAKVQLDEVKRVTGRITSAVVPREAMGFGDVKFIAMIGAFLGWQAVLFTIFAASIVGAVIGLIQKFLVRHEWSRPLPFGPYLALGAATWLFVGSAVWDWYWRLLSSGVRPH